MSGDAHEPSIKGYFAVFLILMALLVVTVWAGYMDFGVWATPIAMAIALVKATFIVLFFMHVKNSSRWIALFFGGSLYVLALGAFILFSDYLTRR